MVVQKLKLFLSIFVVTFMIGCSGHSSSKAISKHTKGDYSEIKQDMRSYIKSVMKESDIIGLSVALVDGQKLVWQEGFGYADKEKGIKATPQTVYRAGSITKLINAMAVMKLVEDDKMELDKPLTTYLPNFSVKSRFGSTAGITPRTLMSHHSGIMSDWDGRRFTTDPYHYSEYVNLIKNEYVAYPPNMIFSYSNLGITLLGHAVEKSAGKNYKDFIKKELFKPMDMHHTSISDRLNVKGYRSGKEHIDYPWGMIPAIGLNSSVVDLSHLLMVINAHGKFEDKVILHPESLREMQSVQNDNVYLDFSKKVGLGMFIDDSTFSPEVVFNHGGTIGTHHSFLAVTKDSKLGVVVMSNSDESPSEDIAYEILKRAYLAKTHQSIPKKKKLLELEKSSEIEGVYATTMGKVMLVKEQEGSYKTHLMGKSIYLKLDKDNRYHAKYMMWGFIPVSNAALDRFALSSKDFNGKRYLINETNLGKSAIGVQVKVKPISKAWKKRMGTYKIMNKVEDKEMQFESLIMKVEDGFPIIEINMKSGAKQTVILDLVNDYEAIQEGIGRGERETIRMVDGMILFSGLKAKKVVSK